MWWAAMKACAPCSRHPRGYPGNWWYRPSGPTSAGTSSMPAVGRKAGSVRPSTPRPATVSTWLPRSRCGHGFSASAMTSTCWWSWCTTSPLMGGRSLRWCVIWVRPMPPGARGRPPVGRRWRCSMSITRCGSARSSGIWPIPTARSPRSWPTGNRPWPGWPSVWRCPPIGPTRRWLISAGPVWPWTGRSSCSSRLLGWPAGTMRRVSWWFRPGWRCCWPRWAPAATWRSGSRSPGVVIPLWMSWWVFSSTPWFCVLMSAVIPPWLSWWLGCGRAVWQLSSTRMCRLRCWWNGSTRPELGASSRWFR